MERNIKLVLAYDGTEFHGWQRQAGVRTVQQDVEDVLRRVLQHPLNARGASRTDAGVHACGQVATVRTSSSIPVEKVQRAVGGRLPGDIALVHASLVAPDLHPSRDARGKLYRYRVFNAADRPVAESCSRYAWHVWYALDLDRMRAAAAHLVGTHDFAGFASQGSPRESTVRTVRQVGIRRRAHEVLVDVEGDGFLYNQVRNMVGTLVEVGRGHWPVERVPEILVARDRRLAGPTAPPRGLCLQWVRYGAVASVTYGAS
jgi:tRNA pseudouridine38-40 synthase